MCQHHTNPTSVTLPHQSLVNSSFSVEEHKELKPLIADAWAKVQSFHRVVSKRLAETDSNALLTASPMSVPQWLGVTPESDAQTQKTSVLCAGCGSTRPEDEYD